MIAFVRVVDAKLGAEAWRQKRKVHAGNIALTDMIG